LCILRDQLRELIVRAGLGIEGTNAIGTVGREYHWTGLGQDIDSRCLELMKGKFFEFSAYMKVTEKNNPLSPIQTINPNKAWNNNLSPVVTLNMRAYQNISTKEFCEFALSICYFILLSRAVSQSSHPFACFHMSPIIQCRLGRTMIKHT